MAEQQGYFAKDQAKELAEEFLSHDKNARVLAKKETLKKVLVALAKGNDVTLLFPHVLRCASIEDYAVRKMIHSYVVACWRAAPKMVPLAVNTLLRDATDVMPRIRALSIRTLGYINAPEALSTLSELLRRAVTDQFIVVRRASAIALGKLYENAPALFAANNHSISLTSLANDTVGTVRAAGLFSARRIAMAAAKSDSSSCDTFFTKALLSPGSDLDAARGALRALESCNKWDSVILLNYLGSFDPRDAQAASLVMKRVAAYLQHNYISVFLAATASIMRILKTKEAKPLKDSMMKVIAKSLLVSLDEIYDTDYILLRIAIVIAANTPSTFEGCIPSLHFRYAEPVYIKLSKIKLIKYIAASSESDAEMAFTFLQEYVQMSDNPEVSCAAIQGIACSAVCHNFSSALGIAKKCAAFLCEILEHAASDRLQNIVIGLGLLHKYHPKCLPMQLATQLSGLAEELYTNEARAAYIRLLFACSVSDPCDAALRAVECFGGKDVVCKSNSIVFAMLQTATHAVFSNLLRAQEYYSLAKETAESSGIVIRIYATELGSLINEGKIDSTSLLPVLHGESLPGTQRRGILSKKSDRLLQISGSLSSIRHRQNKFPSDLQNLQQILFAATQKEEKITTEKAKAISPIAYVAPEMPSSLPLAPIRSLIVAHTRAKSMTSNNNQLSLQNSNILEIGTTTGPASAPPPQMTNLLDVLFESTSAQGVTNTIETSYHSNPSVTPTSPGFVPQLAAQSPVGQTNQSTQLIDFSDACQPQTSNCMAIPSSPTGMLLPLCPQQPSPWMRTSQKSPSPQSTSWIHSSPWSQNLSNDNPFADLVFGPSTSAQNQATPVFTNAPQVENAYGDPILAWASPNSPSPVQQGNQTTMSLFEDQNLTQSSNSGTRVWQQLAPVLLMKEVGGGGISVYSAENKKVENYSALNIDLIFENSGPCDVIVSGIRVVEPNVMRQQILTQSPLHSALPAGTKAKVSLCTGYLGPTAMSPSTAERLSDSLGIRFSAVIQSNSSVSGQLSREVGFFVPVSLSLLMVPRPASEPLLTYAQCCENLRRIKGSDSVIVKSSQPTGLVGLKLSKLCFEHIAHDGYSPRFVPEKMPHVESSPDHGVWELHVGKLGMGNESVYVAVLSPALKAVEMPLIFVNSPAGYVISALGEALAN